jgi:sulfur-carrier protein adenylyltransferase/sulfurtransferase
MKEEGFTEVFSLEGGIRAWEGLVADGVPESGIPYFDDAVKPEEFIALAWILEEGSRRFYSEIPGLMPDADVGKLFHDLSAAEEHHKSALVSLYQDFTGSVPAPDFPGSAVQTKDSGDMMEGGMRISEALSWAEGKSPEAVLELAMSLETNSYDLYIKMTRRVKDDRSRQVFDRLAGEEKNHLERLADLFGKKI